MKSVSIGSYQYKNQVNGEGFFLISVSNCTVFQPRIWTDSSSVGIRSSQVVLKIN